MHYGSSMSTITLKNVPPALHRTLRTRADSNGRSLNKEILVTLESHVHGAVVDAKAIGEHARAVRETMGVYLTQRDLQSFKHVGRK